MPHALINAANKNDVELVRRVLRGELGAVSDEDINSALIRAANNGHPACVSALLAHGASPDTPDPDHDTPLMLAACNNQTQVLKVLLKGGARVNLVSDTGRTALHMASWNGHVHLVRLLLEARTDLTKQDKYGDTALMLAALNGHAEVVKVLVEAGSNVNVRNKDKDTALHYAAKRDQVGVTGFLLHHGDARNGQNSWGMSPLMLASQRNSVGAVQKLLSTRPRVAVNLQGPADRTALHMAAKNGHTRCVQLLISHDAHPDLADNEGQTPVMEAVSNMHTDIVKTLVRAGADIDNFCDKDISICFHDCCLTDDLEMAKFLLAACCQQNVAHNLVIDPRYSHDMFPNKEILEFLKTEAFAPERLSQLCKREIRALFRGRMHLTYTLPLPLCLKAYLNLYDDVYNPKF